MKIDESLINYLEELSYLVLSDEEKARIADELEKILGSMVRLNDLNTNNIDEHNTTFNLVNVFREDVEKPSLSRELILKNAPVKNDETFTVPKTFE